MVAHQLSCARTHTVHMPRADWYGILSSPCVYILNPTQNIIRIIIVLHTSTHCIKFRSLCAASSIFYHRNEVTIKSKDETFHFICTADEVGEKQKVKWSRPQRENTSAQAKGIEIDHVCWYELWKWSINSHYTSISPIRVEYNSCSVHRMCIFSVFLASIVVCCCCNNFAFCFWGG